MAADCWCIRVRCKPQRFCDSASGFEVRRIADSHILPGIAVETEWLSYFAWSERYGVVLRAMVAVRGVDIVVFGLPPTDHSISRGRAWTFTEAARVIYHRHF